MGAFLTATFTCLECNQVQVAVDVRERFANETPEAWLDFLADELSTAHQIRAPLCMSHRIGFQVPLYAGCDVGRVPSKSE